MADENLLFNTNNIRMYIDDSVPCLVNEWQGFIKSAEFRAGILTLLEIYQQQKIYYPKLSLLADTRTLGVISREDLTWVVEEINPRYIELECQYEAFVVSQDMFGQTALQRYTTQTTASGSFVVQIFDTLDNAKDWLKSLSTKG